MVAVRIAKKSALVLGALSLFGCVSGQDIQGLHQHVGDVEKKIDVVSKQSSSKEEVQKLNDNLSKQSATLLRSNADLGAKFDDLIREMQTLTGKLEDANRRLAVLSQQIAETQNKLAANASMGAPPTSVPGGPVGTMGAPTSPTTPARPGSRGPSAADTFAQATADYQRGQYELARQGFQDYVDTYPKTDLSDDALYWIGECYAAQKKHAQAITAFEQLFKSYPQSDKAASAHLKKALAHLEQGEKAQAIVQLNYVTHEYPSSDEAKSARQRLKALGADAR